nr:hypothetical protein [Tanacetum cinerariifolium]
MFGVSGAETRVHTPAPGESGAQNGLLDSIRLSEPRLLVQHMPRPPQSVWSPGAISGTVSAGSIQVSLIPYPTSLIPRRLASASKVVACGRGGGNGGDGNAAGAMHLARCSPANDGDSEASGDGDGVGMARSLSTSASDGKDMAA